MSTIFDGSFRFSSTSTSAASLNQINPNKSNNQIKSHFHFINKLINILSIEINESIISWNSDGTIIELKNLNSLREIILPAYFKHKNLANFIRQLNLYGFKKIRNYNKIIWGFENPLFKKFELDKIQLISRNKKIKEDSTAFKQQLKSFETQIENLEEKCSILRKRISKLINESKIYKTIKDDQDKYLKFLSKIGEQLLCIVSPEDNDSYNNIQSELKAHLHYSDHRKCDCDLELQLMSMTSTPTENSYNNQIILEEPLKSENNDLKEDQIILGMQMIQENNLCHMNQANEKLLNLYEDDMDNSFSSLYQLTKRNNIYK